jgi:hypothetical protein
MHLLKTSMGGLSIKSNNNTNTTNEPIEATPIEKNIFL